MPTTVLIVDDSRVARMMTRGTIAKAHPDWAITEAANGEDALAAAAALAPDFVLVDVNMPGIDGLTTARRMRDLCPKAAISLLTANIQDPVRMQAQQMGVGFMSKPVRDDVLLAFLDGSRAP